MSQIFDLGLSFHFMSKKRITFCNFLKLFFQIAEKFETCFFPNDPHLHILKISGRLMIY